MSDLVKNDSTSASEGIRVGKGQLAGYPLTSCAVGLVDYLRTPADFAALVSLLATPPTRQELVPSVSCAAEKTEGLVAALEIDSAGP